MNVLTNIVAMWLGKLKAMMAKLAVPKAAAPMASNIRTTKQRTMYSFLSLSTLSRKLDDINQFDNRRVAALFDRRLIIC